jgi:2-acylglycerol O-acyltransferase 2
MAVHAPVVGTISLGSSWERRRQSLAMFTASLYFVLPMTLLCWVATLLSLFYTTTAVPVALYLGYTWILDTSPTSGTRWPLLRHAVTWWAHACDYLPLLLVQTAVLDPQGTYVLGYHPHGIISVGCFGAFCTNGARTLSLVDEHKSSSSRPKPTPATTTTTPPVSLQEQIHNNPRGFASLFPGLERRVMTLPQNFRTPFLREYFLGMGAMSCAKESFRNVLQGSGRAVVVVVGGAAESLVVHPGSIELVLQRRRGFVREAILAGASLVPVLAFGETDLYQTFDTSPDHWMARLQRMVKQTTGLGMPVFQGRSLFFQDFGVMPERKPVVVVVGAPLAPPTLDAPFCPEVDRTTDQALNAHGKILLEWHGKYIQALQELYETHKDQPWNLPGKQRTSELQIVR